MKQTLNISTLFFNSNLNFRYKNNNNTSKQQTVNQKLSKIIQ